METQIKEKIERPIGYENEYRDCTVRALAVVSDLPYSEVHKAWEEVGRKDGHAPKNFENQHKLQKACKILNLEAKQVKRHGTVKNFIIKYPTGNYFCIKRGHAFAIINGKVFDLNNLNSYLQGAWLINKGVAQ